MFKPFLRPNKVLAALERGETRLGMQMYTHDPDLVEIVGYTGFDYVMLDMEHNRTNPETMVQPHPGRGSIRAHPAGEGGRERPLPHPLRGGIGGPGRSWCPM